MDRVLFSSNKEELDLGVVHTLKDINYLDISIILKIYITLMNMKKN